MPALYAEPPPSTVTRRMRPSASWPTALRAPRTFSTESSKLSFARKTALPPVTSSGPPPMAASLPLRLGVSVGRISTVWPGWASALRCGACAPRETSTAPPGGIGMPPVPSCSVTTPLATTFDCSRGNDPMTSSTTPSSAGVVAPQAGVYSVV